MGERAHNCKRFYFTILHNWRPRSAANHEGPKCKLQFQHPPPLRGVGVWAEHLARGSPRNSVLCCGFYTMLASCSTRNVGWCMRSGLATAFKAWYPDQLRPPACQALLDIVPQNCRLGKIVLALLCAGSFDEKCSSCHVSKWNWL